MAFIEDFMHAVDNYETDNCETEITGVKIGAGRVLNVGETFEFRVKVTNQSHLDMKSVRVEARATPYADVAFRSGSFARSRIARAFDLDAHQEYTTGTFRGKAKKVASGSEDIVTARIYSWDASLDHILKFHSRAGKDEGKLKLKIHPEIPD